MSEGRARFSKLYDAEVAYTDAALGPVLEKLRQSERPTDDLPEERHRTASTAAPHSVLTQSR